MTNPNATNIQCYSIPVPADASSAQDMRPFAVAQSDGLFYVGTVDSAQSTQNAADLKAYVYTFNPATGQFSTNPVLEVPLNYAARPGEHEHIRRLESVERYLGIVRLRGR